MMRRAIVLAACLYFLPPFIAEGLSFQPTTTRSTTCSIGSNQRIVRCTALAAKAAAGGGANLRMDLEGGSNERTLLRKRRLGSVGSGLSLVGEGGGSGSSGTVGRHPDVNSLLPKPRTVRDAETRHGMPWRRSIGQYTAPSTPLYASGLAGLLDSSEVDVRGEEEEETSTSTSPLLYMPFWSHQLSLMKSNLTNLRSLPTSIPPTQCGTDDVSYIENTAGTSRLVNAAFASDEYRKIRLTYYDAGDRCQVFNSLWYPHPRYDLPVLGIDLLAFNRRRSTRGQEDGGSRDGCGQQDDVSGRYLSVIDFQPIHNECEGEAAARVSSRPEQLLGEIRADYPSLRGKMSDRFYDHKRHFSSSMLYGRSESEEFVSSELCPAFSRSIEAYVDLLRETTPDDSLGSMERVLRGQASYDSYSSTRDPARGLFGRTFGESWADGYVFDFLFDLSDRPE